MRVELLVEDKRTERFLRRVLEGLGFDRRRLYFRTAPSGRGSAHTWVLAQYPEAVRSLRTKRHQRNLSLVAVRDGDNVGYEARKRELDDALQTSGLEARAAHERIATPAPTWSIETWLLALLGVEGLHERTSHKQAFEERYRRAERRAIEDAARAMARGEVPSAELPSLADGGHELARLDPA